MRRCGRANPLLMGSLLALAAVGAWLAITLSGGPKRNVIFIIVDTMRRDALGCYGNVRQPTPHLDAIAREGVRFTQAISTSGWTLPSVASMLTGAWPTIHGALGKETRLTPIRDELPTAAEVLKSHGLNTLAFVNAAFLSPMLNLDRGFDVFDHMHAFSYRTRRADETINAALKQIREHRDESNFVLIHLFDPHLDYDPPEGYRTKYTDERTEPAPPLTHQVCVSMASNDGQNPPTPEDLSYITGVYHGEVSFVDVHVGRLVNELRLMGLYDDALVIITADHGEEFGDHGGFEHGHTLYDELIRVPLIIKPPPDLTPIQHVVDTQVRLVDIMPTVFSWLGVDKPSSFVGESLFPLMSGESDEDRIAFSESTLYGMEQIAWRTPRYKLIIARGEAGELAAELYDWRADAGEMVNLMARRRDVANELYRELSTFHKDLQNRAKTMSTPTSKDISPQVIESLRSLGYIR